MTVTLPTRWPRNLDLKVLREIEVEGIRRQKHINVRTLYDLLIVDNDGRQHEVQCYGLDRITSAGDRPDRKGDTELCRRFGVGIN